MRPSGNLKVDLFFELTAGFFARREHWLVQQERPVSLEEVMHYRAASTPLSDEVARRSNTIVLSINVVAVDLIRLNVSHSPNATGCFGLVILTKR